MKPWHLLGLSEIKYLCPIKPKIGEKPRFWRDSPSHVGKYKWAVDIIIPDPRVNPLPLYAPVDGTIVDLVQVYTVWGNCRDFENYVNYITVLAQGNEYFQICHISCNSCNKSVGRKVYTGEVIAYTGVNGWMTDIRHAHFMVFRLDGKGSFQSLKIRWKQWE